MCGPWAAVRSPPTHPTHPDPGPPAHAHVQTPPRPALPLAILPTHTHILSSRPRLHPHATPPRPNPHPTGPARDPQELQSTLDVLMAILSNCFTAALAGSLKHEVDLALASASASASASCTAAYPGAGSGANAGRHHYNQL